MEPVLQSIRALAGVSAAFVFDGRGQILGYEGVALYDQETVADACKCFVKAVESVQLQMADWETISTLFQDGRVVLRQLGSDGEGQPFVLAVVSDAAPGAPFVAVALRVAVQKLRKLLDPNAPRTGSSPSLGSGSGGLPPLTPPELSVPPQQHSAPLPPPAASHARSPASSPFHPRPPSSPGRPANAPSSPPFAASAGLTWSGFATATGSSGIGVPDAAASAYLTRCAKELARFVGPMSKIYVKEAARRVSPAAPFALSMAKQLTEDLASHVGGAADRMAFLKAVEKL